MRIRGQIGDWPVDLSLELDPAEWLLLGKSLNLPPSADEVPAPQQSSLTVKPGDGQWSEACELLQQAGRLSGPELLEQLEALTGSITAGKRLLVRLRHCGQVRIESGADAPIYCWLG
jgi:hypothetical protein